jgi:MFS family permease
MPMLAAAAGTGSAGAGMMTGALLLGTVMAEVAAAPGIGRFGYRAMIAVGAVLLGAPALVLLLPHEPQAVMAGVSFVRGIGFGLCGVATGALTATLLPAERRGEGLGLLGLVSGVPAVLALPAGIWLAGHHLATTAALVAVVTGLAPLAVIRWLPGRTTVASAGRPQRRDSTRASRYRLPLIFAASTIAAGVLDSFLPIAKGVPSDIASSALLVSSLAATLSRWLAGRHGDRHGHARLLIPALVLAALGMITMLGLGAPVAIFAGMVLFGAGFGVLESATFALLLEQQSEARASAMWNFAYDAGYGVGPAAFGLFSARTGYPVAFALTGVLVLAVLPAAQRERRAAGPRRAAALLRPPAHLEPVSVRSDSGMRLCGSRPRRSCR